MALDEPDGLLAAGGDLSTARLLAAYQRGIFPWYSEGQPILWWSPDPRMILVPSQFHTSRSLARCRRRGDWRFSINTAFAQVIDACAAPRDGQDGTWITAEMRAAYLRLHAQGWAHSLEVWQDDNIAGGIYGLAIDRCFFGESMFHCVSNASKLALAALCERLAADEFVLLDCQMHTAHLATLGAQLMPRAAFAAQLEQYCKRLKPWQPAPI
ncbi:MAG: leucyl/phenylalanyl-tRNA--protein transferase [Pseudomonadota bacterium]